jgi:hypothetical protein
VSDKEEKGRTAKPRTQVQRGKGITKEREVNRRRSVCEWEGCVPAREAIGAPSMLRLTRTGCGLDEDVANLRFELE